MDLEYGPVRMLNVVFTYILYALMHEFFLCKPHSKILAFSEVSSFCLTMHFTKNMHSNHGDQESMTIEQKCLFLTPGPI